LRQSSRTVAVERLRHRRRPRRRHEGTQARRRRRLRGRRGAGEPRRRLGGEDGRGARRVPEGRQSRQRTGAVMRTIRTVAAVTLSLSLLMAAPAHAQLGDLWGKIQQNKDKLKKGAKVAQAATHEFTEEEEADIGRVVAARV